MCTEKFFEENHVFREELDLDFELSFGRRKYHRFHASASEDKFTNTKTIYLSYRDRIQSLDLKRDARKNYKPHPTV